MGMCRVAGRENVCMSFTLLTHGAPWLLVMLFFPTGAVSNAPMTSCSKNIIPTNLIEGPQDVAVQRFGCCGQY